MLPNFLCLGAQKSGTTTLWRLLDAHPQICMATPRETRFFSEPTRFAEGLAAYEIRHFAHWRDEIAVGEKCPEYLYQPEVPARLRDTLGGDLKFLICLRSPAQRAYSHYRHNVFQLRESRSFEAALGEEAAGIDGGERVPPPFGYLGRGLYAEQLQRYFDLFGSERCHLIAFESIVTAQAEAAAGVFAFLGVAPARHDRPPVHEGHPPLEALRLEVDGAGDRRTVTMVRDSPARARGWRARVRALLNRQGPDRDIVRVRRPSPALLALAQRVETVRVAPVMLTRDEELRINRQHFSVDLARLESMARFPVRHWLEA